ncbi:MAG: hypothetical protein KAX66_06975 [Propionivibrio sp.]|nr:hypothetical protein [Propionivibrio sp.]
MARTFLLMLLFLVPAPGVLAQTPESLPESSAYKGEIRRGPDGKLIVLKDSAAASVVEKPATMIVGSQEKITTITEAAKLAKDGDVIEIRSGDYRGQPAVWGQNNLTIRGAGKGAGEGPGKRPVMVADGKSAEGKAMWIVRGKHMRIENIEFRGARVADANGAGIRFESGDLVVHRCAFFDNEMGILTANRAEMTLEISDSEFGGAPETAGDLHHLLYVGAISRFVLTGSRFERGYLGHLVKSRARENHVRYNFLVDGDNGRASYELEFPNGGLAYVVGNIIGQSAKTDNPAIVSYGAEGPRWTDNALYMAHNTLINDHHSGDLLKIWLEKFPAGVETWLINQLIVGYGELNKPAFGRSEGNASAPMREMQIYGGAPARLGSNSPLRGSVRIPGQARGVELLPDAEFVFPAGSRPILLGSSLAPGALQ